MLNGILVVKKEKGYTSNDVVAKMRGICGQRKIGHTGTLDPNAEGVLPVCLGCATKLCDMLTDHRKEYVAEMLLGVATDTQDVWGQTVKDSGEKWREIPAEEIERTVLSFQGRQLQTPPMYSALKVNGKRLYELARAGVEVPRAPREIEIEEIELLPPVDCAEYEGHQAAHFCDLPRLRIRVVCSKGTYIRTICHDIGERLGLGAAMSALTRTRVGLFRLEDAHTLAEVEEIRDSAGLLDILIPVDRCFGECPEIRVSEAGALFLQNGNELRRSMLEAGGCSDSMPDGTHVRVYDKAGIFYGVYTIQDGGKVFRPFKMFLPE